MTGDAEVLGALEFPVRCSVVGPVAHPAEVGLKCRGCGNVVLTCKHHADGMALALVRRGIEAALNGQIKTVSCVECGMTRELFADLVVVVGIPGVTS